MKFRAWVETGWGWPRRELAELLGFSRAYLSQLENGHKSPSLKLAAQIERLSQGKVKAARDWPKANGA